MVEERKQCEDVFVDLFPPPSPSTIKDPWQVRHVLPLWIQEAAKHKDRMTFHAQGGWDILEEEKERHRMVTAMLAYQLENFAMEEEVVGFMETMGPLEPPKPEEDPMTEWLKRLEDFRERLRVSFVPQDEIKSMLLENEHIGEMSRRWKENQGKPTKRPDTYYKCSQASFDPTGSYSAVCMRFAEEKERSRAAAPSESVTASASIAAGIEALKLQGKHSNSNSRTKAKKTKPLPSSLPLDMRHLPELEMGGRILVDVAAEDAASVAAGAWDPPDPNPLPKKVSRPFVPPSRVKDSQRTQAPRAGIDAHEPGSESVSLCAADAPFCERLS